jgi:hypothetical protein
LATAAHYRHLFARARMVRIENLQQLRLLFAGTM